MSIIKPRHDVPPVAVRAKSAYITTGWRRTMGNAISWAAFEDIDKNAALERTRLRDTRTEDEYRESEFSGGGSGTWFVIQSNDYDFAAADKVGLLSKDCRVIGCQVEEHVMASTACCFERDKVLWAVTHLGVDGVTYDLAVVGTPPTIFEEIRSRLAAEQDAAGGKNADVDFMFDVPIELAKGICGYRHDEDTATPFTELATLR
ncbi:MAG: hypothetical protein JSS00_02460 [Proteobacteria bacterium]|nr:hypothetical protein [Pseudomonadota bacterium]